MLPGFGGHLISEDFLERAGIPDVLGRTAATRADTTAGADLSVRPSQRLLANWQRSCGGLGPASSLRTMLEVGAAPLASTLGFAPPSAITSLKDALAVTLHAGSQSVVLIVTAWGAPLDPVWRVAVTESVRRGAIWCLLFNGVALRVVDAGRLYARRFLEFDLALCADDAQSSAALWTLLRADQLAGDGSPRLTPLHAIVAASDRHAAGVCRSLRDGVLSASADVLRALVARTDRRRVTRPDDAFEQALTLVYRMLFLLFAEARGLVPLWHPVYRDSYSIEALRDAAERTRHAGLWDALRAIGRLAHAGCRAGDLRVTPFNGRLFAPARTPLADRRDLDDEAARRSVLALSTRPSADGAGRERIAYRDLGVEQLGAVYETLLDYEPRIEHRTRRPPAVTLERGSGVRKETGTFYTPQPLAEYLVRRTLAPLVREAPPDRILQLRIVDPAMGSGAFLVAACRYVAAAYESALIATGGCLAGDIGEPERTAIRRTIAERCLYGVDLNPMAVQLARLSLWLTTLSADRPLTFLDHRLQIGDSLTGAWLRNLRQTPAPPKRAQRPVANLPLFDDAAVGAVIAGVLPARFALERVPNDTLEQVRSKERSLGEMNAPGTPLARWKRIADLWCAAWFAPDCDLPRAAVPSLSDVLLGASGMLPRRTADAYLAAAAQIAGQRRFFHWELEFPEAFFDARGDRLAHAGFDAVIGNPPWDMMRADAGSKEQRARSRDDVAALVRFTRNTGIYSAQSDGHANRYQLFVERAMDLTRAEGRLGLVLPSGLASDRGSTALRRQLLSRCDVDAIVGLDNRRGVFPIHRSVRFLLLTATAGPSTRSIGCRFGESDLTTLDHIDDDAHGSSSFDVRITPALLERISPDDGAIPWLAHRLDLAIVERSAALFPPLGSDRGWHARFGRELNATDDRDALHAGGAGLPIVEGKQLEPFRANVSSARYAIARAEAARRLRDGRHDRARLAYRDVAGATNRLTLIAAVLPAGCVSTHTVFCLRTPLRSASQHLLCGLFNSFVVNYLVRLRVSTHVTTGIVEQLPVPTIAAAPRACREIGALARLLARRSDPLAMASLQARVAHLYQLSAAEFAHVLETFPLVPPEERERAMTAYLATEAQRTQR
jgi:hypothetical protein